MVLQEMNAAADVCQKINSEDEVESLQTTDSILLVFKIN